MFGLVFYLLSKILKFLIKWLIIIAITSYGYKKFKAYAKRNAIPIIGKVISGFYTR